MKAISYSLFGYDRSRAENCFDFNSYLRGMHINVRMNRIIFPDWDIVINMDEATYYSPYRKIFDWHQSKGFIKINICPDGEKLCKAMLWRLKPVFIVDHPNYRYTHVICRDLDSIPTYREAQMVQEWIEENKTIHCITDSVSHNIPMMGGMIGVVPGHLNSRMGLSSKPEQKWDELLSMASDIEYSRKGSDQDFLNLVIYPKCAESATEHFIKGMPHNLSEVNGRHYSVPDIELDKVDRKFESTNLLAGHVGAAGFYEAPTMKFLYYDDPYKADYEELESIPEFAQVFYWKTREDLR